MNVKCTDQLFFVYKLRLPCTVCVGPRQQHQHPYLMFASNTCTVEFLSKDTVSITSLTALWNSVTLPSTCQEHRLCVTTNINCRNNSFAFRGAQGVFWVLRSMLFFAREDGHFLFWTQIWRNRSFENFSQWRHSVQSIIGTEVIWYPRHLLCKHCTGSRILLNTNQRKTTRTLKREGLVYRKIETVQSSTKLTLRSAYQKKGT